jgi:anti-anti-sigma regulatory factor
MLMITYEKSSRGLTLKLDGRVAGEWVNELADFWAKTAPRVASTKLFIDISDITYADFAGIQALRAIHSQAQAELVSNSPWTRYLAEEIRSIREDSVADQTAEYSGKFKTLLQLPGKFFSKLSPEEFNTLMWMGCPMSCQPGEVLFTEDDPGLESVYLILEGKVMLSISSPDEGRSSGEERLTYSVAKEGDILGLASVLSSTPPEMTAEALDKAKLACIWRDDLLNFLSDHPDVYEAVIEEVREDLHSAMRFLRNANFAKKSMV